MPPTLRSRMGGDLGKEVARSRGSPVHTTGLMADTALMPHLPDRTERIPWKPPYFLYMVNFPLGYPWADHLWRRKGTQGPRSMGMTLTVRYRDKQTHRGRVPGNLAFRVLINNHTISSQDKLLFLSFSPTVLQGCHREEFPPDGISHPSLSFPCLSLTHRARPVYY